LNFVKRAISKFVSRLVNSEVQQLKAEIALRDSVINTLCYRHVIENPEDSGDLRARIFADKFVDQARRGTLDPKAVPPSARLRNELVRAFYKLPSRTGLARYGHRPFDTRIMNTIREASEGLHKSGPFIDGSCFACGTHNPQQKGKSL
jgi:hypothetical protein